MNRAATVLLLGGLGYLVDHWLGAAIGVLAGIVVGGWEEA